MSQQPIIRNVTTMDRGPVVRVTTDDVLKAVRAYVGQFTTYDIARELGAEEYPVRAAVSWLNRYKVIEAVPCVRTRRYTKTNGEVYSATVYQLRPEANPCDFEALMFAFCRG